jgi:hypothetical protein
VCCHCDLPSPKMAARRPLRAHVTGVSDKGGSPNMLGVARPARPARPAGRWAPAGTAIGPSWRGWFPPHVEVHRGRADGEQQGGAYPPPPTRTSTGLRWWPLTAAASTSPARARASTHSRTHLRRRPSSANRGSPLNSPACRVGKIAWLPRCAQRVAVADQREPPSALTLWTAR